MTEGGSSPHHPFKHARHRTGNAMRGFDEGNPRQFYAGIHPMIPVPRARQPREEEMKCGSQPADIRMIHRRSHCPARRVARSVPTQHSRLPMFVIPRGSSVPMLDHAGHIRTERDAPPSSARQSPRWRWRYPRARPGLSPRPGAPARRPTAYRCAGHLCRSGAQRGRVWAKADQLDPLDTERVSCSPTAGCRRSSKCGTMRSSAGVVHGCSLSLNRWEG